jgi:outer membrane murein-binding lipoprotein Lpp
MAQIAAEVRELREKGTKLAQDHTALTYTAEKATLEAANYRE